MFDVYLNNRRDLLVVRNGLPIPFSGASGRWRKKKKVASVSEDIKLAVQRQGYYMRKLTDFKQALVRDAHMQPLQHHHQPSRHPRALPRGQSLRRQSAV